MGPGFIHIEVALHHYKQLQFISLESKAINFSMVAKISHTMICRPDLAIMNDYHNNKYKKTIKLKDEVGMAGSKSTQRFVRHKHLLYIPSLAFLDYYAPSY